MEIILGLLGILLIVCIYVASMAYFVYSEEKKWNNGKCPKCGEPWEFYRHSIDGITYKCKNNHMIDRRIWYDDND